MGKWIHRLSNIDTVNKRADCSKCGNVPIKKRANSEITKTGKIKYRCNVAFAKHNVGIGYGYKKGVCEICKNETDKLIQDHNHKTNKLRGWVCLRCNLDIERVESGIHYNEIISYLKKHKD